MIISEALCEKVIEAALSNGADFAEIFVEESYNHKMDWSDKKLASSLVGTDKGLGLRLFYGKKAIYTHSNKLSEESLIELAKTAAAAIKGQKNITALAKNNFAFTPKHSNKILPWEMAKAKKVDYLKSLDQHARNFDSKITQVYGNIIEKNQKVQIYNSLGTSTFDERNYSRLTVRTIAEAAGSIERGMESEGALRSSDFFDELDLSSMATKSAKQSILLLGAENAPAGEFPVVIGNGFGGVIFHEACGHGLETTSVAKNASVFCGKLNEKIANECVTAIDDGTIANSWGSINIDDEGNKTKKTVLIEKGILKSYIVDTLGGIKTGLETTGSCRRQSYTFAPTSRMRNTYIDNGTSNPEELIADIDEGIYAKKMGGGSVSPGTGAFNFATSEAYLIKNGKITTPLKGASLIGTGIKTLGRITKVASDLELSVGMCGSVSGWVPVTVGQPTIQISKMTVGGMA